MARKLTCLLSYNSDGLSQCSTTPLMLHFLLSLQRSWVDGWGLQTTLVMHSLTSFWMMHLNKSFHVLWCVLLLMPSTLTYVQHLHLCMMGSRQVVQLSSHHSKTCC